MVEVFQHHQLTNVIHEKGGIRQVLKVLFNIDLEMVLNTQVAPIEINTVHKVVMVFEHTGQVAEEPIDIRGIGGIENLGVGGLFRGLERGEPLGGRVR